MCPKCTTSVRSISAIKQLRPSTFMIERSPYTSTHSLFLQLMFDYNDYLNWDDYIPFWLTIHPLHIIPEDFGPEDIAILDGRMDMISHYKSVTTLLTTPY